MTLHSNSVLGGTLCSLFAAWALTACGGGGSGDTVPVTKTPDFAVAEASAPFTFEVNPAASWKPIVRADDGYRSPVTVIDLSKLLVAGSSLVGAKFTVQALGLYDATSNGSSSQFTANMSAVFVDSSGAVIDKGNNNNFLDARVSECTGGGADPFQGDFLIPSQTPSLLTVPPGASFIRVSVDDCFFLDNVTSKTDPLRLSIKPEAS